MNINEALTKKDRSDIATIVLLIMTSVAVYTLFVGPRLFPARLSSARITQYEQELISMKNAIAAGKTISSRSPVTERNMSYAIDEFTKFGKSLGADFKFIRPKDIESALDGSYRRIPIDVEVDITERSLADFMGGLDKLSSSIARIRSFSVTPDPKVQIVHAKLAIDLFVLGQKDEK